MPYVVVKRGQKGFAVKNKENGKLYSKKPMTKSNAEKQKKILQLTEKKKKDK